MLTTCIFTHIPCYCTVHVYVVINCIIVHVCGFSERICGCFFIVCDYNCIDPRAQDVYNCRDPRAQDVYNCRDPRAQDVYNCRDPRAQDVHNCRDPRAQDVYNCRDPRAQDVYSCRDPRAQDDYNCRDPRAQDVYSCRDPRAQDVYNCRDPQAQNVYNCRDPRAQDDTVTISLIRLISSHFPSVPSQDCFCHIVLLSQARTVFFTFFTRPKENDKITNNDLQNFTHKVKDRVTRTLLKTMGELMCSTRDTLMLH